MFGRNCITLCPADMYEAVKAGLEQINLFSYKSDIKVTKISIINDHYEIEFEGVPSVEV